MPPERARTESRIRAASSTGAEPGAGSVAWRGTDEGRIAGWRPAAPRNRRSVPGRPGAGTMDGTGAGRSPAPEAAAESAGWSPLAAVLAAPPESLLPAAAAAVVVDRAPELLLEFGW